MKKFYFFFAAVILAGIAGCYYDNMDDVYPGAGLFQPCDSVGNMSYDRQIKNILENNCVACHRGSGANADVHLDTYAGAFDAANNGALYGATWHDVGYTPMPPNYQLDSCALVQIKKWVLAGAPEH